MIALATFDDRDALLDVLDSAGMAGKWDGRRFHDQSCVDIFEVWPRILVDGEWADDTEQAPKWTANIARALSHDESVALAAYVAPTPAFPRRVFA